jgi:hypothetical protein
VHLLYLHNWRRTIGTRVSHLSQKRVHLRYKLKWDASKRRSCPFFPPLSQFRSMMMRVRMVFPDQRRLHLRTSLVCVSDFSFLHSGSPRPCRLRTVSFWPRWQALICTGRMSGFMGPSKPSSPVNTSSNRTSLLRGDLLEGEWGSPGWRLGQASLGAKTASLEQESNFNEYGYGYGYVIMMTTILLYLWHWLSVNVLLVYACYSL